MSNQYKISLLAFVVMYALLMNEFCNAMQVNYNNIQKLELSSKATK